MKIIKQFLNFACGNFIVSMLLLTVTGIYFDIRCRIRDFRRIRNTVDITVASTNATSFVHSRLDYCNSLYLALSDTQMKRLQPIQKALIRDISRHPDSNIHTTFHTQKTLNW